MPTLCVLADRASRELGGAEVIAYEHARGFAKRGWRVVLVRASGEGVAGAVHEEGMTVYELYAHYPRVLRHYVNLYNPQTISHLRRIFAEHQPDIVHAHNLHLDLSYAALPAARRFAKGVFLTAHDVGLFYYGRLNTRRYVRPDDRTVRDTFDYRVRFWEAMHAGRLQYNPFRRPVLKMFLRGVDKMFPVSDALREALRQNGFANAETIHNGIDWTRWTPTAVETQRFRGRFGLGNRKLILWGGRLRRDKGAEQLFAAFAVVAREVSDAHLVVAGDQTGYGETFFARAAAHGLGGRISMTGWLSPDDMRAAYGAADVVVVPSIVFDSFPNMVLEAMAAGKPVVATCFGGSREAVQEGLTGFIVNPFNVALLARRLSDLLRHADKAQAFGCAGQARARENFSLERYVEVLARWYELVLLR